MNTSTASSQLVPSGPNGATGTSVPSIIDMTNIAEAGKATNVRGKRRMSIADMLPMLIVFAGFIGLWYLVSGVVLNKRRRFLLPAPHTVISESFFDAHNRNELLSGIGNTAKVAIMGFAVAAFLALVFSTIMALSKSLERAFFPYAVVIQTIPILALVPLLTAWFGPTRMARVVVCVLVSLFPILTSFLFGLKSVERGHHELFTLHGANWWTRLTKLQFPAALPSIFVGLRVGAGLCVIGALVGDFFLTRGDLGMGRLLSNYAKEIEYPREFGGIILCALLGIFMYALMGWLGSLSVRNWHDSETKST
jgi:NitT/TauT family transport system permease protein